MNYIINMERFKNIVIEHLNKKELPIDVLDQIKESRCPYQFVSPVDPEADASQAFQSVVHTYISLLRMYDTDMTAWVNDAFTKFLLVSSRWTMEQCIGLMVNGINEGLGPGTMTVDQGFIDAFIDNVSTDPKLN